jgi:hypothetical protein
MIALVAAQVRASKAVQCASANATQQVDGNADNIAYHIIVYHCLPVLNHQNSIGVGFHA